MLIREMCLIRHTEQLVRMWVCVTECCMRKNECTGMYTSLYAVGQPIAVRCLALTFIATFM